MKKIRLRKWFKYLLIVITIILLLIVVSDAETLKIGILKAIEYIEDNSYQLETIDEIKAGRYENEDFDIEELLDILKGSDTND